nr:demethoxyubiquinone hydroxylase family protein [Marinicella litoralis]
MACTWAVESVVVSRHLKEQLIYLKNSHDKRAFEAVSSIPEDEENHRDTGGALGGKNRLFKPIRLLISLFTETIIRFGMR